MKNKLKIQIIYTFLENPIQRRSKLLKKFWMYYSNTNELDEVMLQFDAAGMILIESDEENITYRMPESQVNEIKRLYSNPKPASPKPKSVNSKSIRIRTITEFEINEGDSEYIETDKMIGELVKIKSGEYENLLMGTIISAEWTED